MIKRLYGYVNSKDANKKIEYSKNTIFRKDVFLYAIVNYLPESPANYKILASTNFKKRKLIFNKKTKLAYISNEYVTKPLDIITFKEGVIFIKQYKKVIRIVLCRYLKPNALLYNKTLYANMLDLNSLEQCIEDLKNYFELLKEDTEETKEWIQNYIMNNYIYNCILQYKYFG